jgi:DNA (cytosine-5)-methyltransferase 1
MRYEPYTLADMNAASEQNLFTVISTFAGAGGSSTGYKLAGGKVLVSNEFVDHAYESYKLNHPGTVVLTGDIKEIEGAQFLNAANLSPGELDIFDGSPPCTHFSMSGKREKSWDQEKNYHGHKQFQIEKLTLEMIRIAKDLRPKTIVIENVKALSSGKARDYLNSFKYELENIGYKCISHILNASHFGVPQGRERTFIIGVRNDVAEALGIEDYNLYQTLYPEPSGRKLPLLGAFDGLDSDPNYAVECQNERDKLAKGNIVVREVLKKIPHNPHKQMQFCDYLRNVAADNPNEPKLAKFKDRASYFNYFRCSWETPSPTITGRCHSYFHPSEDRCFTLKELMRIMSLPDDFKFAPGSEEAMEERIGLMVAPKVMKAISSNLYNKILKPFKELQQ